MLLRQGDIDPVVRSRSLQFQIKRTAESLAQCQSPRLIDTPTKRSVNHQLHPAALIEKSFGNHFRLRGHRAQHRASRDDVLYDLFSAPA